MYCTLYIHVKDDLKSSIIYYCLVSLYLQMQLDAIKLIELNKLTWKLSSAFHPVCSDIHVHVAATL